MPHTLTPEQNFFRAIPQLAVLDSEQIFELARKTTKQKYRKGEYVFLQGEQVERLYFLEILASLAGTSREVAARCLKLFRERGVVSGAQPGRPRNIVITRPEELQRIVDEE